MNILVIGGNGFIGSHLVDYLIYNNHNVRVFDISYERFRKPLANVDYRIFELNNVPNLYEALLGIDVVFHLASTTVPSTSNIDTISDINNNLIPTLNILHFSVKLGIKKIVYFSSGGTVYGNPMYIPINEEHPLNPISSYGIGKVCAEMYLNLYDRLYGINSLIIRPSNPYGPRQGHYLAQGVISTFLRKVKLGEDISVFGDGNSSKDYIYINDLIKITYDLSFGRYNGIFNIGSGEGTTLNQIIDYLKIITDRKIQIRFLEKQIYDVDNFVLDISKTIKLIGDYKFTQLEEGMSKTWNWLNYVDKHENNR